MKKFYLLFLLLLLTATVAGGFQQDTVKQIPDTMAIAADSARSDQTAVVSDTPAADTIKSRIKTDAGQPANNTASGKVSVEKIFDFNIIKKINVITLLEAIVFLFAGFIITKIFDFAGKSFAKRKISPLVRGLIITAKILLWVIIFHLIVSLFVTNADELLLFLFVAVLVITGIAAMPVIKNFIGGFYLSIGKPFERGDYISVAELKGEVRKTGWRSTVIETEEKSVVSLPNSMFLSFPVENINVGQKEQAVVLEYEFPVEYDEKTVKNIIKDSALASPYLFINGDVTVLLEKTDFVRNTNKFKVNLYIYDAKYESELTDSINTAILKALKQKSELKEKHKQ